MKEDKVFIYSEDMDRFPYPASCPFNTSRAERVRDTLSSMGLLAGSGRREVSPKVAEASVLEKFHTAEYLDTLQKAGEGQFDPDMLYMGLGTGDCPVFEGVYDNGLWAAGGTVTAAEMIIAGDAKVAFNPSGGLHHAHPKRASGFCYVNDVVLGCMSFVEAGKKVLYVDVDVHHGDGVQEAFYQSSDVMTISLHQDGRTLFPGTGFVDEIGKGRGKGFSVNIPLPPGTYDEIYLKAFDEVVVPLADRYEPDVIVIEVGVDGLAGDPLAGLSLTNNVYAEVIEQLLGFGRPILAVGGGGYHIENTVRAWSLAWTVLCGEQQEQSYALGGVMLQSSDWQGGFRDRVLAVDKERCKTIDRAVEEVIKSVKTKIFPIHKLQA